LGGSIPPFGVWGARRPAPGAAEDGSDRISRLPDDLLLDILAHLCCARAAAHTSLLSRRWRGLWRHLPELSFREIAPAALNAALANVARKELSLLDISITIPWHYRFSSADLALLLGTGGAHFNRAGRDN
ncbi:hypothetical protein BAE44_0006180, partial [Dichanthelium oligosanthes]